MLIPNKYLFFYKAGKNYVFQEGVVEGLQEEIRRQKEEKAKELQKAGEIPFFLCKIDN